MTSRDATTRRAGRLSAPVLAALDLPRDADAYVCGPAAFMAEMSAALAGLGIGRVRTEIFGAAPALTPGIARRGRAGRRTRRPARRPTARRSRSRAAA